MLIFTSVTRVINFLSTKLFSVFLMGYQTSFLFLVARLILEGSEAESGMDVVILNVRDKRFVVKHYF